MLNEIIKSQAVINFIKELQKRFFYISGASLLFVALLNNELNFSKSNVLNNSTVFSGLFIAYIIGISFIINLISIIIDFCYELSKENKEENLWYKKINKLDEFTLSRLADLYFKGHTSLKLETMDSNPSKISKILIKYRIIMPKLKGTYEINTDFIDAVSKSDKITYKLSEYIKTKD
jgi:hypothetical protein